MENIAIVGAGHVGITYAAGFAELGHRVRVVDVDRKRLASLRKAKLWFHEPRLAALVGKGIRARRLSFTTSYAMALRNASFVFVCVGTPTTPEGGLDDSALRAAFASIKQHSSATPPIVVNKSTSPIGTGDAAATAFMSGDIQVVSNPEFLSEGRALEDFFHPSRVVIGARNEPAARAVAQLYAKLAQRIILTDPVTAEMTKLASNAFLATKISFINALARIAQQVGADVDALSTGLGLDPRIGGGHLRAGLGFGGSCLPKDVLAVEHLARRLGAPYELFAAVTTINREQRSYWIEHLSQRWGSVAGRTIAVLGQSFKPDTDDTRESPALALATELVAQGANVRTYDPVVKSALTGATKAGTAMSAAKGADAIIVATEWPEFGEIDLRELRAVMKGKVFIDGRGIYEPSIITDAGFEYVGFRRSAAAPVTSRRESSPSRRLRSVP